MSPYPLHPYLLHTVELNLEPTGGAFAEAKQGPATELVLAYVEGLLVAE
jgi:hypothetical protein